MMRSFYIKVIFASCMFLSFLCCAKEPKFISYSPEEFEKLLNSNADIQLVDVRRPEEFDAGHIEKAILINVQASDFLKKAKSLLDDSKPVAVYCRSGRRSKDAARQLTKAGFIVYELDTGFLGWMDYKK